MSGSLTAYNPLLSGGGVNTAIPLSAGQGAAQLNPLAQVGNFADTLGKINQLTLQKQAITGGAATVAQHLQQVGTNAMLPFLAIDNPTMGDLTNAAAYAEKIAGGTTNHIMQIAQNNPYPVNTAEWGNWMKRSIGALSQTSPESAIAQVGGAPVDLNAGGSILSGVRAPAYVGGAITPASTTNVSMTPGDAGQQVQWTDKNGATQFGTKAQYNTALGNGQVNSPAVVSPVGRPGSAAPAAPAFGNPGGRYQATPTQPDNPALRNPAAAAPAAPPANAVQYLRANPTLAPAFDQKYGPGAAARILGQ